MLKKFKTLLLGNALKDSDLGGEKFNVKWGLPIYSSDAISSVAYAGEEILLVLVPILAMGAYRYFVGAISLIILLLFILVFSYRQTIDAYPQGGGAYGVTTENLGQIPGLVAGASLIIGYILTVAASAAAATAAVYSAFPQLVPYRVFIALGIVLLLTWGNLRGMRESAVLFGTPTYIFIGIVLVLLVVGFGRAIFVPDSIPAAPTYSYTAVGTSASLFLFLRAFGSGCTALTGVEAVSNAVPNFKEPSTKNAKKVLVLLSLIIFVVFLGISVLTSIYHVLPDPSGKVTVIAQLAGRVFGEGSIGFYVVQIATVVILALAANTAFAGLPVLLYLIAKDGYAPRSLMSRGSKLSYSNGIALLAVFAGILLVVFEADTHSLLPLYATGVFLSFTLSQTGMLVRWIRLKTPGWRHKAIINGIGALMSATTCVIVAVSKFMEGAWMVLIALPVFVWLMLKVKKAYNSAQEDLALDGDVTETLLKQSPTVKIILPMNVMNRSFLKCLNYALSIQGAEIELFHVGSGTEDVDAYRKKVESWNLPAHLIIETTEYRNYNEVLLRHIREEQKQLDPHQMLTIIVSQVVVHRRWQQILHNKGSEHLKKALEKERNVSVISIPYLLK